MESMNSSGRWIKDRHDAVDHAHIDDLDIDNLDENELKTIKKLRKQKQAENAKHYGRVVFDKGGAVGGDDYAHADRVIDPHSITSDKQKEHKHRANKRRVLKDEEDQLEEEEIMSKIKKDKAREDKIRAKLEREEAKMTKASKAVKEMKKKE